MTAAVLGIGNRMRGDDAVGPLVVDALRDRTEARLFDCGTAPENFVGPVRELAPGRILLVDACAFGGDSGEFRLFDRGQIDELAMGLVSTHTLPLGLTVELLAAELDAEICLLGVQPERLEFGRELSPAVALALPRIADFALYWLVRP